MFCRKCCSLGLTNCCWIPNCITKKVLADITWNFQGIMREGLENIVVNFHCIQMSTKNVVVCYQTTDSTKRHNSKTVWSICMKFPGIMCLVMKDICGKFRCKQTSSRKVIALAFIYVNPHLAYSMNDAYMPCAFERMTHMCVNQRLRWNVTKVYEQASDWEGGFPMFPQTCPKTFCAPNIPSTTYSRYASTPSSCHTTERHNYFWWAC